MTGIQTLTVLYELLNEVVTRAVTAVSQFEGGNGSTPPAIVGSGPRVGSLS